MASGANVNNQQPKAYFIKFTIEGQIEVFYYRKRELLEVKWLTSPKNDMIADTFCLLVLNIKDNPTPQLI